MVFVRGPWRKTAGCAPSHRQSILFSVSLCGLQVLVCLPSIPGRHEMQTHSRAEPEGRASDRYEQSNRQTGRQQPPNQREASRHPPTVGEHHMSPQDLETDDDNFLLPRNCRGEVVGSSFHQYPTHPGE
jgi:hypothetical protein